jgi:hypothetical protein
MPPKPILAPFARSTSEVDLTNDATSQKVWIFGTNDFTHEFMTRRPAKPIVASLKFKVRVANTTQQQSNQRESFGTLRPTDIAYLHTSILEMNS